MPSNRVRVLVALPNRLFLDALCRALTGVEDIVAVAETTDAQRAIELATNSRPEVAVLDSVLWKQSHSGLVRALHAHGIGLVLLRPNDIDRSPNPEFSAGASESISVEAPLDILIEAIRKVAPRDLEAVKDAPRTMIRPSDKPISILTSQEIAVLRLLAEGFTTKEISKKLQVAVRTVENHRSHLGQKLDIHSMAGLIRYAIRHHVVSP